MMAPANRGYPLRMMITAEEGVKMFVRTTKPTTTKTVKATKAFAR
jgi:hypothetical protein